MSAGHDVALQGALDYGTAAYASIFDPPCDAYRASSADDATTVFSAHSTVEDAHISTAFRLASEDVHPFEFFKNVTNQPTFADGRSCDNMIRLFNTSVTRGIENVKGEVRAKLPLLGEEMVWEGVYGVRMDTAFVENNYVPCEQFRGYTGME